MRRHRRASLSVLRDARRALGRRARGHRRCAASRRTSSPHSSARSRRCASAETSDEWRVPPAIDFATLARADYFASLPQWLTVASHLSGREDVLLRGRRASASRRVAVRDAATPPVVALNPAVCYHVYAATRRPDRCTLQRW